MATKIKTPLGELKYVFITGAGRNQAMPGNEERMQFVASLELTKDSKEHKALQASINTEWDAYKVKAGLKPAVQPKTNGIKAVLDKETGAETDKILVTFKTDTHWKDGKPQVVKVFDHKGADITSAIHAADWSIGSGSTGIIHGSASGNDVGGAHKVTLYLTAVQIAKLVNEIDGDDIDLGESVSAIGETPDL
jgi:hypothetical protein